MATEIACRRRPQGTSNAVTSIFTATYSVVPDTEVLAKNWRPTRAAV
jgi:hypothetical protein